MAARSSDKGNAQMLQQMLELMKSSGVNLENSGIDPTALGDDSLEFLQQKMQQFRRPKARRHEEVDDEEEARRQEELALRDFFTAQAAQQRKDQGLAAYTTEERELVAAGFRYDYVDSVHEYISQIKALSKYCWYVGVLGVLLAVVAREIEFNNKNAASIVLGIRFCNSLVTLLLWIMIYTLYSYEFKVQTLNSGYLNDLPLGWQTWRLKQFWLEIFICGVHDFPGLSWWVDMSIEPDQTPYLQAYFYTDYQFTTVLLDAPWSFLMVLRVYLMVRCWRDERFGPNANVLSIFSNFDFNVDFALRAILDSQALLTLFKMLMVMVACMSYLLHVCEREVHANIYTDAEFLAPMGHWTQSYFGSIWLVFASLTTLGYADIIPLTYCGRVLCFFTVVLGICIVSGLTGAFNVMLTMPPFEQKMRDFMSLIELRLGTRNSAANTIASAYRFYKARQRLNQFNARQQMTFSEFRATSCLGFVRRYLEHQRARANVELAHQTLLLRIHQSSTFRTDLANYVSRFGQTIHLQNRLEVIARRMGMAANLTFGEDRDKHINNYIVYCMAQMFGRHVDKHAAAAGVLKPKVEMVEQIFNDDGANESDEFESDSDDEKYKVKIEEIPKSENQLRLDKARTMFEVRQAYEELNDASEDTHITASLDRLYAVREGYSRAKSKPGLQRQLSFDTMLARTQRSVQLPEPNEKIDISNINRAQLSSLGKRLSTGDVDSLNTMLDRAQAQPEIMQPIKIRRRKYVRGRHHIHHHHHHMHGNLIAPTDLTAIPNVVTLEDVYSVLEAGLNSVLEMAELVDKRVSSTNSRLVRIERQVRGTMRFAAYDEEAERLKAAAASPPPLTRQRTIVDVLGPGASAQPASRHPSMQQAREPERMHFKVLATRTYATQDIYLHMWRRRSGSRRDACGVVACDNPLAVAGHVFVDDSERRVPKGWYLAPMCEECGQIKVKAPLDRAATIFGPDRSPSPPASPLFKRTSSMSPSTTPLFTRTASMSSPSMVGLDGPEFELLIDSRIMLVPVEDIALEPL